MKLASSTYTHVQIGKPELVASLFAEADQRCPYPVRDSRVSVLTDHTDRDILRSIVSRAHHYWVMPSTMPAPDSLGVGHWPSALKVLYAARES